METMTTADETYNGWTNYETWITSLWIDNDQGSYTAAREIVAATDSRFGAAEALRDWVAETLPDLGGSLAADLLGRAVERVNWVEIVDGIREEES